MKATIFVFALAAATVSAATAATITNLYDTGVTNANVPLVAPDLNSANTGPYVFDSHFTTLPGTGAYTFDIHPPYFSEVSINGRWISTATSVPGGPPPTASSFATSTGVYDYTETFSLAGLDPNSAIISGNWASDDCATIFVNGVATGQTIGGGISSCLVSSSNFTGLSSFLINSSNAGFNPGVNTLDYRVYNAFGSTALLVTNLQATANAVPEPSAALLALTGLVMVGIRIQRRPGRTRH